MPLNEVNRFSFKLQTLLLIENINHNRQIPNKYNTKNKKNQTNIIMFLN